MFQCPTDRKCLKFRYSLTPPLGTILPARVQWLWRISTGRFLASATPSARLGTVMLDVRDGNRRLEIKPKKAAIEVGGKDNLAASLTTLKEPVEAQELDQVLMAAREERVGKFRRRGS